MTNTTPTPRRRIVGSVTLAAAVALLGAACGDDDAEVDAAPTTEAPADETDAPADADGGETDGETDETETVTVVLQDFSFGDLPETVPAGTRLTVVNEADYELHELVAIRLPDDEERPVEELAQDQDALGALLGAGPPAAVLLAEPGGEAIPAVGDGTLSEPGRYMILCMIPTGVEPAVYLQAAAESHGEPPQVEGGPPHLAHGMFAELVVE